MAYDLQPFDESYFDTAPMKYTIDVHIPVAPETAWAEFTRQNTLDWCRALNSVTYTSPAPYGVGTTRSVALAPGVVKMDEYFFLWDEDSETSTYKHGFHGVRANIPGLRKFGEYTEVSPTEHGSRLVWKFAMELGSTGLPPFLSGPIANGAFGTVKTDTVKHFATFHG
ncbi:SRPBCC family protein [Gordonia sihwensis]|uniref:SRPBCC family protein n=1 Tax=Gordonia TaxID=2053 RepID=UPI002415D2C5|nr:SRPBCC family protein [Gordonia sihwensis]WFN93759.1 SRPBCC family protein [Gordonia sihwensis]